MPSFSMFQRGVWRIDSRTLPRFGRADNEARPTRQWGQWGRYHDVHGNEQPLPRGATH